MRIKSNSGVRGGAKIALPTPVIEKPIVDEVEGIEEVIEDDEEEDESVDGGVG